MASKNSLGNTSLAITLMLLASSVASGVARGSDIQPRLFTNIPIGIQFLGLSYTRSEGSVSVDPSLALDVEAELDTYALSYTRAFGLLGKSATASAILPYADLMLSGVVDGESVSVSKRARVDPTFRLAVNVAGAPALSPKAFANYRQKTIIGVNLVVTAPWGDYDADNALNFGANRWSISPEAGLSRRAGRFTVEAAASLIWFSDNTEYRGDSTLKQEPIYIARANLLYHFKRPGTWIGIGTMYLSGGETTVDGTDRNDLQIKSRSGIGLSLPINRRHSLMFKYSTGVSTRIGADFDNYNIAYAFLF
jgi:hypothetical protein